jgi:hypothetical protein
VSDASPLTPNILDPSNGQNNISQSYEEANPFSSSQGAIAQQENGIWDFSLVDNTAPFNTNYCFRVVKQDGSLLDSYEFIPEL